MQNLFMIFVSNAENHLDNAKMRMERFASEG